MKLKTQYRPLGNLIMCIQTSAPEKIGQIILPDNVQASVQLNEGEVFAIGPICSEAVHVGDTVTWDMNTEYKMKVDGEEVVLINEGRCLMIKRGTEAPSIVKGHPVQEQDRVQS